jgi:hypothetical protein
LENQRQKTINQRFQVEERLFNANSAGLLPKYFSWRLDTACKEIIPFGKRKPSYKYSDEIMFNAENQP